MACCRKYKHWKVMKKNTMNVLNVSLGTHHGTLESKCEIIGLKLCEKIDKNEMTLDQALDDILEFSRDLASKEKEIQMAWLSLHLALGLCYNYKVQDKEKIRGFLKELLIFTRGVDMGLFMRDILHYENLGPENVEVAKSFYCLSFTAGYKVNLLDDKIGDKIFVGPTRIVYRHLASAIYCNYLDLPIGHPTLSMSTKGSVSTYIPSSPLGLACESFKPKVVRLLVRYGASPIGKPLDHILTTLGCKKVVEKVTGLMIGDTSLENVKLCLEYCLRAVRSIKIRVGEETTQDVVSDRDNEHVHLIRESALEYLPDDCYYKTPAKLKHLARCEIRDIMFQADTMTEGIDKLPITDSKLKHYLDLML